MDFSTILELIEKEMEKYGLLELGWTYGIDRSKVLYGLCRYREKIIYLEANHIINDHYNEILNTIRHEIAHALVGFGHDHDEVWQAKAVELGARPERYGKHTTKVINLGYERGKES